MPVFQVRTPRALEVGVVSGRWLDPRLAFKHLHVLQNLGSPDSANSAAQLLRTQGGHGGYWGIPEGQGCPQDGGEAVAGQGYVAKSSGAEGQQGPRPGQRDQRAVPRAGHLGAGAWKSDPSWLPFFRLQFGDQTGSEYQLSWLGTSFLGTEDRKPPWPMLDAAPPGSSRHRGLVTRWLR